MRKNLVKKACLFSLAMSFTAVPAFAQEAKYETAVPASVVVTTTTAESGQPLDEEMIKDMMIVPIFKDGAKGESIKVKSIDDLKNLPDVKDGSYVFITFKPEGENDIINKQNGKKVKVTVTK